MTAGEKILQKALVGSSKLDSRQWNSIQAGLRDRAFFSSQVASVRVLHAAREMAAERAGGNLSESEFRREMRKVLGLDGYDAGENRGTIKDLVTKARLDVIQRTNVEQARGYIHHLEATAPGAFAAFPAQELVRVRQRKQPRDWVKRWHDAGGKLYEGRMIALIDDPVWTAISAFGNPFPPFDFGSGMGVRAVKKSEAVRLGVISADEVKAKVEELRSKPAPDFNANLQATIPMEDNSPEARTLKAAFGDQVRFDGNVAHWQGELIRDVFDGKLRSAKLGRGYNGRNLSISHSIINDHITKHVGDNEKNPLNMPLSRGDFELIPAMWRKPDGHSLEDGKDHLTLETFDGGVLHLFVDLKRGGISTFYKTKGQVGA